MNDEQPAQPNPVGLAIRDITLALSLFVFRANTEAVLQTQVAGVLEERLDSAVVDREVRVRGGRFDVQVTIYQVVVVLELKLHSPAAPVERQAQRYALMPGIDAVGVVTTSSRLAHSLGTEDRLGGRPFFVVTLRTT